MRREWFIAFGSTDLTLTATDVRQRFKLPSWVHIRSWREPAQPFVSCWLLHAELVGDAPVCIKDGEPTVFQWPEDDDHFYPRMKPWANVVYGDKPRAGIVEFE